MDPSNVHADISVKQEVFKACKNYLKEVRYGTGVSFATRAELCNAQLQSLDYNSAVTLPALPTSTLALDSTECRFLISGSISGSVRIADLSELHCDQTVLEVRPGHARAIREIDWYKNDTASFITSSKDLSIKLWDTERFEVVDHFNMPSITINSSIHWRKASPNLIALATSSSVVELIDPHVGSSVQQLEWQYKQVELVRWHPSEAPFVFLGTRDGRASIYDIRMSRIPYYRFEIKGNVLRQATFTADGSRLVILDSGGVMRVFRMDDGKEIFKLRIPCRLSNRPRFFELIEESYELRAIISNNNKLCIVNLCNNPLNISSEKPFFIKDLDCGFVGAIVAAQFRRGKQHIIAASFDNTYSILTPSNECSRVVVNRHQQDNWSSDEDNN